MSPEPTAERLLALAECRSLVGLDYVSDQRFAPGVLGVAYEAVCHRWKHHPGDCRSHTRRTHMQNYYRINRRTWPEMPRSRALWSAWRCWRMVRPTERTPARDHR